MDEQTLKDYNYKVCIVLYNYCKVISLILLILILLILLILILVNKKLEQGKKFEEHIQLVSVEKREENYFSGP